LAGRTTYGSAFPSPPTITPTIRKLHKQIPNWGLQPPPDFGPCR